MAEETKPKSAPLTGAQIGVLIGALAVYAIAPTTNIPNVITSEIQELFQGIDPGTLSYWLTITNLAGMLGAFLFGITAGKILKFKTVTIIALCCYVIGGCLPFFFPDGFSIFALIGARALLGLGMGCCTPMAQTVIITTFKDDEQTRAYWLGIGGICFNIAITLGSTIAGSLALIGWRYVFLFYAIGLIPLILMLLLYKETGATVEEKEKPKVKFSEIPARAYVLMLAFMLAMLSLGFFTSFGRTIVGNVGLDPLAWGTIMTVRTVGSILVAAIFGFIYKFVKNYCLVLGGILLIVGMGCFYFFCLGTSPTLPAYYVGAFTIGFGMNMLTCGMAMVLSTFVRPEGVAYLMGMSALSMNLGTFLSSPCSQVFFGIFGADTPVVQIFMFAMIIEAICAALYFFGVTGIKKTDKVETPEA